MLCLLGLLAISCTTKKEIVYMQNIADNTPIEISQLYLEKPIQVNDILKIDVTALEELSLLPYKTEQFKTLLPLSRKDNSCDWCCRVYRK